jgi:hypothetical protein
LSPKSVISDMTGMLTSFPRKTYISSEGKEAAG